MNKVLVAYKSNYGSAKAYASYIAQHTHGTLLDTKEEEQLAIDQFKTIVFCGSLYAGKLNGLSYISGNKMKLDDKNIIIVSVGTLDIGLPSNVSKIQQSILESLPEKLHSRVKIFYVQGTVDYEKLGLKHKAIMGMLYHITKRKNKAEMSPDDMTLIKTYGTKWKEINIALADPVVEYIETLYKKK